MHPCPQSNPSLLLTKLRSNADVEEREQNDFIVLHSFLFRLNLCPSAIFLRYLFMALCKISLRRSSIFIALLVVQKIKE